MKTLYHVACLFILCMILSASLCGCITINLDGQYNDETQTETERVTQVETERATERITVKEPETTVQENGYSFSTVANLLAAIKANPYKYANQEIQVKGTLCKCEGSGNVSSILALVDTAEPPPTFGVALRYEVEHSPNINIKITDDILYSVAEHNDYLQITGTVKISNGEIYLDNCTYTP